MACGLQSWLHASIGSQHHPDLQYAATRSYRKGRRKVFSERIDNDVAKPCKMNVTRIANCYFQLESNFSKLIRHRFQCIGGWPAFAILNIVALNPINAPTPKPCRLWRSKRSTYFGSCFPWLSLHATQFANFAERKEYASAISYAFLKFRNIWTAATSDINYVHNITFKKNVHAPKVIL